MAEHLHLNLNLHGHLAEDMADADVPDNDSIQHAPSVLSPEPQEVLHLFSSEFGGLFPDLAQQPTDLVGSQPIVSKIVINYLIRYGHTKVEVTLESRRAPSRGMNKNSRPRVMAQKIISEPSTAEDKPDKVVDNIRNKPLPLWLETLLQHLILLWITCTGRLPSEEACELIAAALNEIGHLSRGIVIRGDTVHSRITLRRVRRLNSRCFALERKHCPLYFDARYLELMSFANESDVEAALNSPDGASLADRRSKLGARRPSSVSTESPAKMHRKYDRDDSGSGSNTGMQSTPTVHETYVKNETN